MKPTERAHSTHEVLQLKKLRDVFQAPFWIQGQKWKQHHKVQRCSHYKHQQSCTGTHFKGHQKRQNKNRESQAVFPINHEWRYISLELIRCECWRQIAIFIGN
jgi:hypothetical protein